MPMQELNWNRSVDENKGTFSPRDVIEFLKNPKLNNKFTGVYINKTKSVIKQITKSQ